MSVQLCPACRSENRAEALFCDQCGQNLRPVDPAAEDAGACPACGGKVRDHGDGSGECESCGLELKAGAEAVPAAAASAPDADAVLDLTNLILKKTAQGVPLEKAVADSCREAFAAAPAAGAPAAAPAAARPCPVCGVEYQGNAQRCPGCGIWFAALHAPGLCPACGAEAKGAKCACGAILTVPALLDLMEPAVRFLCSKCKQPYAAPRDSCADCGGKLTSASRIRDFARSA